MRKRLPQQFMTTEQVAQHFNVAGWRIRRIFERQLLPTPPKFGGKKMIPHTMLRAIEEVLRQCGWYGEDATPTTTASADDNSIQLNSTIN